MGSRIAQFRRVILAWAALAGMAIMSAGPVALGHPSLDTDCVVPIAAEHDHTAHRMGQAPEADGGHCVACHLTRSARGAMASDARPAPRPSLTCAITPADESARAVEHRADFTRGPPSRV